MTLKFDKKFQNTYIIYIESEREENRIHAHGKEVFSPLSVTKQDKRNLKSSENLAIINIESERRNQIRAITIPAKLISLAR